jgi:hypothetical protein
VTHSNECSVGAAAETACGDPPERVLLSGSHRLRTMARKSRILHQNRSIEM